MCWFSVFLSNLKQFNDKSNKMLLIHLNNNASSEFIRYMPFNSIFSFTVIAKFSKTLLGLIILFVSINSIDTLFMI